MDIRSFFQNASLAFPGWEQPLWMSQPAISEFVYWTGKSEGERQRQTPWHGEGDGNSCGIELVFGCFFCQVLLNPLDKNIWDNYSRSLPFSCFVIFVLSLDHVGLELVAQPCLSNPFFERLRALYLPSQDHGVLGDEHLRLSESAWNVPKSIENWYVDSVDGMSCWKVASSIAKTPGVNSFEDSTLLALVKCNASALVELQAVTQWKNGCLAFATFCNYWQQPQGLDLM